MILTALNIIQRIFLVLFVASIVTAVLLVILQFFWPETSHAAWSGYRYTCTIVVAWKKAVCGWSYDPNCPDWWPEDGICDV